MNIKYHEKEKQLEIKDGLRTVYLILKVVMLLNILTAAAHLYSSGLKQLETLSFLYLVVGVLSIGVLLFLVFKKATDEIIPIDSINNLREKSFFGKRFFSLQLKNGKGRDLTQIKSESEISELTELFHEIGISTRAV